MKLSVLFCAVSLACVSVFADEAPAVAVKTGDTIAFLGDSVVRMGNDKPAGFIHLVLDGLKRSGIDAKAIPAGRDGHKSNNMLDRVNRDVIEKKPQWMLLSCGVNDVWHGANGVPLEDYKKNIAAICDKADKAGIKVMIMTPTMIYEDPANKLNAKLADYNIFLRQFAKERNYLIADLNAQMQSIITLKKKKNVNALTIDGVHMNAIGNQMMAAGILRSFGVSGEKMEEIRNAWDAIPETICTGVDIRFSVNEWRALQKKAEAENTTVENYLRNSLNKYSATLVK